MSVSTAVRIVCAWLRPTPDYFPDEYMYASFSRSLAGGRLPAVRGASAHFLPLLQPLLTAPAWLLPTVEDGYRATQAIESLAMSLAAVPVYYLARQVGLGSRLALAAAALSLTVPALIYSSFVLSEPVAYPIALGAVAAAVRALDRPSVRSFALFLAVAAAAMLARMQFAILIPCFVLALVAVAVRERRFRAFVGSHRLAVELLLGVSAVLFALGPARNTGYYPSFTTTPGFKASEAVGLIAPDALVLAFAGGFVLVAGALLGIVYAIARPLGRAELAFGALTTSLTVGLLAEAHPAVRGADRAAVHDPGVGVRTAQVLIAECGVDMSVFPTAAHFDSWAAVCPGTNQSGRRRRPGKTRHGNAWLSCALTEAAYAAVRTKNTYLASHYWQLRGRRGDAKAIGATRHDILIAYYHTVSDRVPYRELGPDWLARRHSPEHRTRRLVKQLEALGHRVTLEAAA